MKTKSPNTLLFGVTIFVSSALLFSIQPMIAKMLLPLLGGTPAVWNTCMVFFQAVLLGGYAYALLVSRWSLKRQLIAQLTLLCVAFVSLPIGLSSAWVNSVPPSDNPSLWVLLCLAASVGLPFFIVSSNSPLLQKWFSRTTSESARDPYFLYAASNAGSLLSLLAYPALMEPFFTLRAQGRLWTVVYAVLVLLIGLHAIVLWRSKSVEPLAIEAPVDSVKPSMNRRLRWLLLAFAPSSLMLGVTNYITTDIASVPLLWIIPLALYLLTMVFAFARKPLFSPRLAHLVVPGATIVLLMLYFADTSGRGSRMLVVLHLAYFFFAALMCHGQLAADRPGPKYLAEFYVWLSLGGVLGGIFNALLAPMLFSSVVEYPLAILLSCLLLPNRDAATTENKRLRLDFALPVFVFIFTIGLGWMADRFAPPQSGALFVVGVPLFISYPLHKRPVRFALTLGAIILAAGLVTGLGRRTLHSERNFFGVLRVTNDQRLNLHSFLHGSTVHGRQNTIPAQRCEPLAYYHRNGPFARILAQFQSSHPQANVAIIGLGTGATAVYARPSEHWTFYEINPAVVSVAQSREYFSFLSDCTAAPVNIVLGDARLKLHGAPDRSYDLLVLDAFSSDAIPVHLMTQQAVDLYLSKLAPGGMIVFHISNRNLDLSGVVANLAKSRDLSCLSMLDLTPAQPNGKDPSHWIVLARNSADYGTLANDPDARQLVSTGADVWTDDFSNILSVFKWRK